MKKTIWYQDYPLEGVNFFNDKNMVRHLGIELVELGPDFLRGTMPVDHRTQQPMGLLHGGASVVLAESLGSIGANLVVNPSENYCVGLEINANHLRPVKEGIVSGEARPVHIGKQTQVWEIRITDEQARLVCISRLTMAVLRKE